MTNNVRNDRPDLVLGPFSLTVHGYQFTSADNIWDANWLFVTAQCEADGATVRVSGSILSTTDLAAFGTQCDQLYKQLKGEAVLDSLEPELRLKLHYVGKAGHLEGSVEITPDQMTQRHQFSFALDQSFLPAVIEQCGTVLQRFPVREVGHARGA